MTAASGRGLYDDFRGCRIPTDEELDEALRTAMVVVDANVLLSLYRYNETTRDDLLELLRRIGARLWVPHQALREFWRNRLGVMSSRGAAREQILSVLTKQQQAMIEAIQRWAKVTAVPADHGEHLVRRVRGMYTELEQAISGHSPSVSRVNKGLRHEPVLDALEILLRGRVGPEPDTETWQAAVAEGKARAERRKPPGYLDAEKAESELPEGPAGDYLVWKQAIDEVARRGGDLLIVTGDEKEDWWWRYRSDFIGPRQELVTELAALCGAQLFMMRPTDLLRRAEVLQVKVRTESVDEAERVSRDTTSRSMWAEAGVIALLDALDAEGQDQALVIREAAARGGRIDREAIYDICGYEDDRMLRGFTRPAARVTRDLQAEGIVAEDVEPALTPVYVGVKAAAFRIPAEMVAILASGSEAGDTYDVR
jgi:hypothetical protein